MLHLGVCLCVCVLVISLHTSFLFSLPITLAMFLRSPVAALGRLLRRGSARCLCHGSVFIRLGLWTLQVCFTNDSLMAFSIKLSFALWREHKDSARASYLDPSSPKERRSRRTQCHPLTKSTNQAMRGGGKKR